MEHKETIWHTDILHKSIAILVSLQNLQIGTIFFDFSGHVGKLDYKIYLPIWKLNADVDYQDHIYLDVADREVAISFLKRLEEIENNLIIQSKAA